MILHDLMEAPNGEVAIIFGRFNPPHKGHKAAWEMAAQSPTWYVGTNRSTQGPKDPLPFDVKIKAMAAIWPEVADHIVAEQSWLTLASKVYSQHGDVKLIILTDEEWVSRAINQYNGVEGPHGLYKFSSIVTKPTPRLSSATALRDAVIKGDRKAFSDAAGISADAKVAGAPFFDLVAKYLLPYQEKAAKPKKKTKESMAVEPDPSGYQKDVFASPKYTLVIDTPSDLDWYKIGQHFPNLGTEDPHEYGQSDTDMTIAAANREELEKLKAKLDRLGLKYKEIGGTFDQPEIHSEAMRRAKVTLYTDPDYYGADVDDNAGAGLPVKNIPLAKLVGFEPDEKMKDAKSAANMGKMVNLIKSGKGSELPPILVRKYKSGYQVLDGHHRFHAYQAAGAKTIPGKIVPDSDIEVKSKGPKEITTESRKASKAEAGYQSKPKDGQRCINCTMWRDPHWCTAVADKISPNGWCKWFAAGAQGKHGHRVDESSSPTNISLPDGKLWISDHFLERIAKHGLDKKHVANMVTKAIKKYGSELAAMEPIDFVIRDSKDVGIAMRKYLQSDDTYRYVLMTIHPRLRISPSQHVFAVESDDLNVQFHSELNPALWDKDGQMRPEVRDNLMKIAQDFKDSLGIRLGGLKDITVSGSNAAYSYTSKSDVDLHLVVDIPEVDHDNIYRELFDAKKFKYNTEHDYKIRGYDVELYVQDANQPHISQGIYSIMNDAWVSKPRRTAATFDETATKEKYDNLKQLILQAIKGKDHFLADKLKTTIKKYRQVGLETNGEFGPENLAFKAIRANGYMEKLYDLLNDLKDEELSIHEEELTEIDMSPGALKKFSSSPIAQSMTVGFEAEMIVPGLAGDPDDYESEPDYEADERVETSSVTALMRDLVRFFRDTESRSTIERVVSDALEDLNEYIDNQFRENVSDEEIRAKYKEDTELTDEEIDKSIEEQDSTWDEVMDTLREEFTESWDDLDSWLDNEDLSYMVDWHRRFDLDWPYWTEPSYDGGDVDASDLAKEWTKFSGYKSKASRGYHSADREPDTWIFEPDSSINPDDSGSGGIELVSPPMPLAQGIESLEKFFTWAGEIGADANRSTGFHMGVSIPNQTAENIDHLKLILLLGDQNVLARFGRSANSYTQSIYGKIKDNLRRVDISKAFDTMRKGMQMAAMKAVGSEVIGRQDRYVSVNIKPNYIEFRSAGGRYFDKKDELRNVMLRYVRVMAAAADPEAEKQEYAKKLYKLLSTITGDETNTIKAFSLYTAGAITRSDLISMLKKAQVARINKKLPQDNVDAQPSRPGVYGQGPDWYRLIAQDGEEVSNFQAPNLAAAQARQAEIERRAGERFVLVPAQGNTTATASDDDGRNWGTSARYEIFDRETGETIRDLYVPIFNNNWINGDEQAMALLRHNRAAFGDRNVSVRRATTNLNDSKSALTGKEMMEYYNSCHHAKIKNSKMESYILKNNWTLSECGPEDLPDASEYADDAFGREMKLDLDQVKKYMEDMSEGKKVDPIIMGPNKSIIDGNHRAQAARKLNKIIECYKTLLT